MLESEAELAELQSLLDRSHAHAGPQLRRTFDSSRASASDVVGHLGGVFEIHLATLAADGSPLVARIDAVFVKGKVWFSLSGQSVRTRLVSREPRVSASFTDGAFALIVHGTARRFDDSDPHFGEVDDHVRSLYVAQHGEVWDQWRDHVVREQGPGTSAWIEPRVLFAKRGD